MSIVSGTVGAVLGSDAQKDANKTNRSNTKDTNAQNYLQFLQSRGLGGSAVLPSYMGVPGNTFEKELARGLMGSYRATMPESPSDMLTRLQKIQSDYVPMRDAAVSKAGDIFNGNIGDTLMANYAPVEAARTELGQKRTSFRRQAAIDALNNTLSNIEAVQAGKGYSGDSLSQRMMTFAARKQAADDESEAKLQEYQDALQTAGEKRSIADYSGVQLPLANLNLPAELMAQGVGLDTLPQRELMDFQSARMQPLTFLRIGQGQPFQYSPMPLVQPVASPWQLMAQGGAAFGNMAADYAMKRDMAGRMQPQQPYPQYVAGPSGAPYQAMPGNGGTYYEPAPVPQANTWSGPNYNAWQYMGMPGGGGGTAPDYGLGGMAY